MKPRRTHSSNHVFELVGGNEDNSLYCERTEDLDGNSIIASVWVPTDEERQQIAAGFNIKLNVWGSGTPPVAISVTDETLGKAP